MDTIKCFTEEKSKKVNPAVEQIMVGGKIVALAVIVMGLFFLALKLLPSQNVEAKENPLQDLSQEKIKVELQLQETLQILSEAKKKVEATEKLAEDLRNQRNMYAKKIDAAINPEYKPEIESKK